MAAVATELKLRPLYDRIVVRRKEAKEQDKAYRRWLKSQGKAEKAWDKADEKERKEFWKAQKMAEKQGYPVY